MEKLWDGPKINYEFFMEILNLKCTMPKRVVQWNLDDSNLEGITNTLKDFRVIEDPTIVIQFENSL